MKRMWSILAVCVILLGVSGIGAFAGTGGVPDTTAPRVWGFGSSPTMIQRVYCPNNVSVMIQAKASDIGGIAMVRAQVKRPGASVWTTVPLALRADGYWRGWAAKEMFTTVGVWKIRVQARDFAGNTTTTGIRYLGVTYCHFLN